MPAPKQALLIAAIAAVSLWRVCGAQTARMENADLSGQRLHNQQWSHACLGNAELIGTDLTHSDLRGADLSSACLFRANLENVDLRHADLSFTNLQEADLRGAHLDGATLRNAQYNSGTRWPRGFDPEAHGAVRMERQESAAW